MFIDRVNLNHLRLFEAVYKARSMTVAAQELHLTQSGVSQHVKALEDVLGVRLFDRVKQRLIPTKNADSLYKQSRKGLMEIEQALWKVTGKERAMEGTVSVGIPREFGHDVVLPLLCKLQKKYPGINYRFQVGLAPVMSEQLLRGDLDLAIVDDFTMDRRILLDKIYDEGLELCISSSLIKRGKAQDRKYFESLKYIAYDSGESLLRTWFGQNLCNRNLKLEVNTYVQDAYCVSQLILGGMGAGVLPSSLYQKLLKDGHPIHAFKGSGKMVREGISIAWIKERSFSPAVVHVIRYLKENIARVYH